MDDIFIRHLKDLSDKADRSCRYTFTDFLNADEQNLLFSARNELITYTLFGGTEGCERVMAKFGNAEELGYEQEFPIRCILAEPLQQKFADKLTHRDILGALMSLGIERAILGDIILNENKAYIFTAERMTDFITEHLTSVKHTTVKCSVVTELPACELFKTEDRTIIAASERIDCVMAGVFNLSRSKTNTYFASQKVFINGRLCENNSAVPKPGDTISVRGLGRFIFCGTEANTKKGRNKIAIKMYI